MVKVTWLFFLLQLYDPFNHPLNHFFKVDITQYSLVNYEFTLGVNNNVALSDCLK